MELEPIFNNGLLLVQIAVIIGLCRLSGSIFRRFGQPQVVGEMIGGILLGPTLLGVVAPAAYASLFPASSLVFLTALSHVGLIVFIYLVGVQVDLTELRRNSGLALVTSNVSVAVPLLMGAVLAVYLFPRYGKGEYLTFALFIGTAMSVTAFPVLARILRERNLIQTPLGSTAIACAAVDDITAWILLAAVVGMTNPNAAGRPVWHTLCWLVAGIAVLAVAGRLLQALARRMNGKEMPANLLLGLLVMALLFGAAGEWTGIHALAGAFLAGVVTPTQFREELVRTLEPVTLLLLVPVFFALTGIRTDLFRNFPAGAFWDTLLILIVAVSSKFGGTLLGAWGKGLNFRDGCRIGLLMNTRGLVELVILNVGYERGILSSSLYSMMIVMALVTTAMTTPLWDWLAPEAVQPWQATAVSER